MKYAIQFIVLASTKVGESSLVLHTLSARYGRRSFITSVRKYSDTALYLPLNLLCGEVSENAKSDLWRLSAVKAEAPLSGIRRDMDKNALTLFISEVLYRAIHDGTGDEGLYDWCCANILLLDALEGDFSSFHLRFLLELCGQLGFMPTMDDLAPFAGKRYADLSELLSLDRADFLLYPLSGERRSEIAEILIEYLGHHLGKRLDIRSLGVLKDLYAGR